jgi:AAA domain
MNVNANSRANGQSTDRADVTNHNIVAAVDHALGAMHAAPDELEILRAIRDGARQVASLGGDLDTDALERLSNCAIHMHNLDINTVQEMLAGGVREARRERQNLDLHGTNGTNSGRKSHTTSEWRTKLIDPRELCERPFGDVKYVVPGLFPEGVMLLASRPKIGKSWLLLQVTTTVATGVGTLAPSDQPAVGDVLYLALEDNPRRLQRRLAKYFGSVRENWPARLRLVTEWRRLDQGGLDDLREWCGTVEKPALIAIDTLKKVRPPKGRGQTDYDADYEACEGLQKLAGEFAGLSIIVAHHDRKMDADDVFDTVSGTLGLTGGVDTVALIKRRNGQNLLFIEGRDLLEPVEKAVAFDRETCRWSIVGEAAEVLRSVERSRVLKALQDAPEGLRTSEIVAVAELRSRNAADLLLSRMTGEGEIERVKRGLYGTPGTRANLSFKKEGQMDREKRKSLKRQKDNNLSSDLSICPKEGEVIENAAGKSGTEAG